MGIGFYLEAQNILSIDRSLNIFGLAYGGISDWPDPVSPVTVTCTRKLPYPYYTYYIPSGIHSAFSLSLHPSVLLSPQLLLLLFFCWHHFQLPLCLYYRGLFGSRFWGSASLPSVVLTNLLSFLFSVDLSLPGSALRSYLLLHELPFHCLSVTA